MRITKILAPRTERRMPLIRTKIESYEQCKSSKSWLAEAKYHVREFRY